MTDLLAGELLDERAQQALSVPLQARLGAQLLDPSDPTTGVRFLPGELADNGAGGVHAAALQTLLEVAGYLALLPSLRVTEHAVTHAVATQFISAAPLAEPIIVRGTVDRRTRKMAFLSVLATAEERPIARGQLSKSIIEAR